MRRSESIKEITSALLSFRKQVGKITKTRTGNDRGREYKFASLSDVQEAIQYALMANGLNVIQMPDETGLTTILSHGSGEWIESHYEWPSRPSTPQGLGSVITYMRRYALAATLDLHIEDNDDDGAFAEAEIAKATRVTPTSIANKKRSMKNKTTTTKLP